MRQSINNFEQRLAEFTVRPLRFGFIIRRDISENVLLQVYQYNSSLWGGRYNIFVPTDGESLRADWMRQLYLHDPDIIFYVGDIDDSLSHDIYHQLLPLQMFTWNEKVLEGVLGEPTKSNAMKMDVLFEYSYEEFGYRSPETPHIVYPIIEDSVFAPYLRQLFGTWVPESHYYEWVESRLGATKEVCNPKDVAEYLGLVDKFSNRATPLSITGNRLNRSFGPVFGKNALVISDGTLDDLFVVHALRWSDRFIGESQHTIILPIHALSEEKDFKVLGDWCSNTVRGNTFEIVSYSLPITDLISVRDRLKSHLSPHSREWGIDIRRCNAIASVPDILHTKSPGFVNMNDDILSVESPQLKFSKRLDRSPFNYKRWICDINLSPGLGNRQAFLPSMFEDLDLLLSGHQDRRYFTGGTGYIRIARGKLALTFDYKNPIHRLKFPSHEKVIETMCINAGYTPHLSESNYYEGILGLFDQLQDLGFLQNESIRTMFLNQNILQGEALSLKEIYQRFKISDDDKEEFENWLKFLIGKRVFLQGYNLKCPICGLDMWYDISRVEEYMECEGCRRTYQIPIRLEFSYRLNHLFQDGQNQGVVTEILTLLLLENTAQHGFIWQANSMLTKGEKHLEIDIIAMLDGYLIVGECKNSLLTHLQGVAPDVRIQEIDKLMRQIDHEVEFAVDTKAHLYLYSVLSANIPQEIRDHLDNIATQYPDLEIRIVTKEELTIGKFRIDEHDYGRPIRIYDVVDDAMLPPLYEGEDCFLKDESTDERFSTF